MHNLEISHMTDEVAIVSNMKIDLNTGNDIKYLIIYLKSTRIYVKE